MNSETHRSTAAQLRHHPLEKVPGRAPAAQRKLATMRVCSLESLCVSLSRQQLKRLRHVGSGSYEALCQAVVAARLAWPEFPAGIGSAALGPNRARRLPTVNAQADAPESLQTQLDRWVATHRRPQWLARQQHQPGAYGAYLKAQLDALDELPLSHGLRQQERHRIVRLLGRYRRQVRLSTTAEAVREGVRARG